MPSLFPRLYTSGPIEAIADPGQNLLLQTNGEYYLFNVTFVEAFPESAPIIVDLTLSGGTRTTLAAGASTAKISVANQVDMNAGELGQFRFRIYDFARIALFQGQALGRNADLNAQANFTPHIQLIDPHMRMTEHFIWEQQRSFLQATNPLGTTLNQIRVGLFGFRYVLAGSEGVISPRSGRIQKPLEKYPTLQSAINDLTSKGIKFTVVPISGWAAA